MFPRKLMDFPIGQIAWLGPILFNLDWSNLHLFNPLLSELLANYWNPDQALSNDCCLAVLDCGNPSPPDKIILRPPSRYTEHVVYMPTVHCKLCCCHIISNDFKLWINPYKTDYCQCSFYQPIILQQVQYIHELHWVHLLHPPLSVIYMREE